MSYELIGTITTSGQSVAEFTGIPQDGKDLLVKISARNESYNDAMEFRPNYNTGSVYYGRRVRAVGDGNIQQQTWSATDSFYVVIGRIDGTGSNGSEFCNSEIYISDYASSAPSPIAVQGVFPGYNSTFSRIEVQALEFRSNSPITSLHISNYGANYTNGSVFTLYKIL
jgi:hypothetical protein